MLYGGPHAAKPIFQIRWVAPIFWYDGHSVVRKLLVILLRDSGEHIKNLISFLKL